MQALSDGLPKLDSQEVENNKGDYCYEYVC